jgi:hypothetical protein
MLPYIDDIALHVDVPGIGTTFIIGVLGYSNRCGKSALAVSLGGRLEDAAVYTGNVGVSGTVFHKFTADVLLQSANVPVITDLSKIPEYSVVVLDDWVDSGSVPDLIVYILPENRRSDTALGLRDSEYDAYVVSLCEAIDAKYPGVSVKLVDESLLQKRDSFYMLDQTDKLVIRALERNLLSGSPLNEYREMLRNSDMETWRSGDKL